MPPIRDLNLRFGFLGCGQMGFAMAQAIVGELAKDANDVNVFDASEARNIFLKDQGFHVLKSNREVIETSHVIVLCVKPSECIPLLNAERKVLDSKLVISVAAGINLKSLQEAAPKSRFARIVTNLAAVKNSAISTYSSTSGCSPEDDKIVEHFINCFGESVGKLEESKLHAVSAVSSSSLAFVATVIEGMSDGGVQLGLPRSLATKLASYAAIGTGMLLVSDGNDISKAAMEPAMLKNSVCSPGGTTICGVRRLEQAAVRSAFMEAVIDTCNRSIEIMKSGEQ